LTCVSGLSNTIFLALLEFIIQLLLASDETLPVNTNEAKKFLREMRLGYEKIMACHNDYMLFQKGNKELDHLPSVENLSGKTKFIRKVWSTHIVEQEMSDESVAVVFSHPTTIEVVYVKAYYALYEVACRRLH